MDDLNFWSGFLDKDGIPTIFLAAILYAAVRAARWVAPQITGFADKYLELVEQRTRYHEEQTKLCQSLQQQTLEQVQKLTAAIDRLASSTRNGESN